ncbi:MAG TPA: NADPH-dependent F420 reductase [Terriglobales bacterium]|nr:NADPH-dependent F420 reductase [Terriglobales bacterium]
MTIAIVGGTGPAGSGLAFRLAMAGEGVVIGSRDAKRAAEAAAALKSKIEALNGETGPALSGRSGAASRTGALGRAQLSGAENSEACRSAEIVILTIPFQSHAEMVKQLKPSLKSGQIVVDATVPLASSIGGRSTRTLGVWHGSAAQQAAELVPEGVAVVAAFHNVSAELLKQKGSIDCDVIVCSDDKEAGKRVRGLVRKIPGLRAIDGGKLENARIVETITALLIGLNIRHKGHSGLRITGLPPAAYDM